uniref:GDSL esterase/lipase n=1 Tax=Kalanchoe fedtschenkoi TaxID=63787 RepID=A0A7N0RF04_KALFE
MSRAGLMMVMVISLMLSISTSEVVEPLEIKRRPKPAVPAVFVFGDSTVDPGNNNFIGTPFTSNFPPYGQDFPGHRPTGRFSNGRLVPDFVASYAGIKDLVPPYLDPMLSWDELLTGVSFASAGSGLDPLTPQLDGVLSVSEQLDYFREYKSRVTEKIGKKGADELIGKAVYVISIGTNDFVINYITLPVRRKSYSVLGYEKLILQYVHELIRALLNEGAKKISFGGLPPMGCLPAVITLYSKSGPLDRSCIDSYSAIARSYNKLLEAELAKVSAEGASRGVKVVYADVYSPVMDMIQQQDKYGKLK